LLFFFLFVSAAEKGKARDEATLGSGRMTQNSCCLFKHRPTIDDDHRLHEKAETNEEKKKKKSALLKERRAVRQSCLCCTLHTGRIDLQRGDFLYDTHDDTSNLSSS
jgi:hypothetical protein